MNSFLNRGLRLAADHSLSYLFLFKKGFPTARVDKINISYEVRNVNNALRTCPLRANQHSPNRQKRK